jgi:peptide-methionine (S)-S-oxide reductase
LHQNRFQKATFAAGCFWGVEEAFRKVKGVVSTRVSYTGGWVRNPSYQQVCAGETGHAEAVEVTFDPQQVSYQELLELFWNIHDPTTLNRQGWDVGTQYRSAIFVHSEDQRKIAEASRQEASGKYRDPIVTEVVDAKEFWPAEEYHQRYFEKRSRENSPSRGLNTLSI